MREGCLGRTDGLAPLTGDQRRDLLEVIDDRHQRRLQSERVTAFNRNPRRQSSESAGDLAVKASRPRATGKKDGRKTLTLESSFRSKTLQGYVPRQCISVPPLHRSPHEVLWSRIPFPSNYLQATGRF
jgi:hypothetical protein